MNAKKLEPYQGTYQAIAKKGTNITMKQRYVSSRFHDIIEECNRPLTMFHVYIANIILWAISDTPHHDTLDSIDSMLDAKRHWAVPYTLV